MAQRADLRIPSGERTLAATLVSAQVPSGAAVLFVHGLGSSRSTNIERAEAVCTTSSATCLAVDLGGHGDSTGRLSEVTPRQNLADVVAAHDALAGAPGVDAARIGVCAASYGAYLAVLLTALRPVARMLLRAPALYADDCFDRGLARRRFGDAATAPTPLAHLALFPGPVTIVESERDEVISADTIAAYRAAQPEAVHVVQPSARHALTDPAWRAQFQQMVVDCFADL
ncbi:MAG: alpha/beta fold hydrolase [Candidatus Nanopelagicales bacterium]|jgi:pimeloyl-ACP methyl ester carboxylesterase|nr:alpha/beta fold hydrolase [Candidatus Nanopelagicales bacterium]